MLPKASPVPNFPDNALQALGPTPQGPGAGTLNYVSVASASVPVAGNGAEAPGNGGGRSTEVETTGAPRARTARPGVAGTAVPSANGPLDIFVIDGGINSTAQPRTRAQ
jgi:hypothetical protein